MTSNATALKLKQVASYIFRGTAPSYVESSPIQVVNQSCVSSNGLDFSKVKYHDPEDLEKIGSWIHQDDILVNSTGTGTLGRVAFVNKEPENPVFADGHVTILRDDHERFHPKFLYHFLSIQQERLTALCSVGSTNQIELNRSRFSNLEIPLPPISQQRRIADYLDRETAKIDALIAAKQRLLGLLGEKRRSLTTHTVTRGLKSHTPEKDSGIEWLGKIPKDWRVVSLNYLAEVKTGVTKGRNLGYREVVEVPYLRVANVQDGYLDLSNVSTMEVLPEEVESYSLREGDVLMNEGGDADKLGRGAVWDGSIKPCLHQNHVFAVRCHSVHPYWLATMTSSDYSKAYFESRAKQSTNLASISSTNLKELPVVLPPKETQTEILSYLQNSLTQLDKLLSVTRKAVELLQERRTSLISAAVTGQILINA